VSLVGWHSAVVLGCTTAGMCWHPRGGVFYAWTTVRICESLAGTNTPQCKASGDAEGASARQCAANSHASIAAKFQV